MQLSTPLKYAGNPRAAAEAAICFEDAGVDMLWVSEAYGFDSPTTLGFLAAKTTRVQLGPAVLSVFSRSATLLAQTAAGLDALSGGRAALGLGASGPAVISGWHGLPYAKPLARTRDVVAVCRKVWAREAVEYHGATVELPLPAPSGDAYRALKMLAPPLRPDIPIFLAALGPRSVALTAEVADGWLPYFFFPEHAGAIWGDALAEGAKKRSPSRGPLQVVANVPFAVGDDEAALRDRARPQLALYIGGMGTRGTNFYNQLVRRFGFGEAAGEIQRLYLSGKRKEAEAAIPDELLAGVTLIGPGGYIRERIHAFRSAGVTMLNAMPVGDDPVRDIAALRCWLHS